jgi:membrane protein implicated in regulation of membrane protease activity
MDAAIIWGAAGLILIIADVVFGSFFMLFLGAGALTTAALIWGGFMSDTLYQWLCFAAASSAGVLFLRKPLLSRFGAQSAPRYDEHTGQRVLVCEAIPAGGTGRVVYRGAEWPARTHDGSSMPQDAHALIQSLDGIVLIVQAES